MNNPGAHPEFQALYNAMLQSTRSHPFGQDKARDLIQGLQKVLEQAAPGLMPADELLSKATVLAANWLGSYLVRFEDISAAAIDQNTRVARAAAVSKFFYDLMLSHVETAHRLPFKPVGLVQ